MKTVKKFKVGDYVEVVGEGNTSVNEGEQGVVTDASDQSRLGIIFSARDDLWAESTWRREARLLKLLYRPPRYRGKEAKDER